MTPRPRSLARGLAILFGAPAAAFAIGAALVVRLPLAAPLRFPIGAHMIFVAWVTMVLAFASCRSGAWAWAWCAASLAVAAALLFGGSP